MSWEEASPATTVLSCSFSREWPCIYGQAEPTPSVSRLLSLEPTWCQTEAGRGLSFRAPGLAIPATRSLVCCRHYNLLLRTPKKMEKGRSSSLLRPRDLGRVFIPQTQGPRLQPSSLKPWYPGSSLPPSDPGVQAPAGLPGPFPSFLAQHPWARGPALTSGGCNCPSSTSSSSSDSSGTVSSCVKGTAQVGEWNRRR